MPTPTPPRRPRLDLTVSSPGEPEAPVAPRDRVAYLPWLAAAAGWSAAAAVLGLAAVGVLAVVGWLTALRTPPAAVLHTAGQGWLAAHGAGVALGPMWLDLTPLALTGALVAACAVVGHHAGVQAVGRGEPDSGRARLLLWARVVAVCVGVYAVTVGVVGVLVASPAQAVAALPGAVAVSLAGAGFGAVRGVELDPLATAPRWARRLPAAVGLGCATLAAGAASALVVTLVAHWPRVLAFHDALAPDPVGTVLAVVVQLLYLPTLVGWAGAWVLGAGVALGPGSVASPGLTATSALPAIPVLGAVPEHNHPWAWSWLLVGAVAGAVAGWVLVRGLPADDHDAIEGWPWQGAVAGAATGGAWVVFAWLTRGDLGTQQLAGLGPVFPDLLWLATVPLGLAGGAAALGAHLLALRRLPPLAPNGDDAAAALPDARSATAPGGLATVGGPVERPDRPLG